MQSPLLQLADLYAPIAADLDRVRSILGRELQSDQPAVAAMCRHVSRYHGKLLRPAVLLLAGRCFGPTRDEHLTLAAVVELVHVATLVHDDVLDEADVRRAAATVNRRWGTEQAVLLGDFLISHAFYLCSSLDSQDAARVIGRTTNTVCEGEMLQVARRGDFALSESEYFDIIARKTASLIAACCLLGARFAGAHPADVRRLECYGQAVGVAFQVADDLLDLTGDEPETGKSVGRDADAGKLTLPLIHHLRCAQACVREETLRLLSRHEPDARAALRDQLRATHSLEYALDAARSQVAAALDALEGLPESEARASLTAMADFILTRRS